MRNEKRFLRTLKRDIKRTGNRKRRRFLKNIDASPEDFDLGRDRTDVMNEQSHEKPRRWDRANNQTED
jgi:hypothetical protein